MILLCTTILIKGHGETTLVHAPDELWKYTVQAIRIEGNQRTASRYIFRELTFEPNQQLTLEELKERMNESRINLVNTSLFINHSIELYHKLINRSEVVVIIRVEERWYLWPEPILETADQNFNAWILDPDLGRLNYGINLIQENLRGYNERLSVVLRLGADKKYEIRWSDPAIIHSRKIGMGFGAGYEGNHEVPAAIVDNRLMLIRGDRSLLQKTYGYVHLTLRQSLKVTHLLGLQIAGYQADTALLRFNPTILPSANSVSTNLIYFLKADYRNHKAYPLRGSYLDLEVRPVLWLAATEEPLASITMKINGRWYHPLRKRLYHAAGVTLGVVAGGDQPFLSATGLGFGREFVRGFEYDVIQGEAYGLLKQNLKFALIPERRIAVPFAPHPKFKNGSVALYLNIFLDAGYVIGPEGNGNNLVNKGIGGTGVGIDLVTYYDKVVRLEGAINSRGRGGVYVHFIAPI
jgi:outer membrane protein assembly factor BamA